MLLLFVRGRARDCFADESTAPQAETQNGSRLDESNLEPKKTLQPPRGDGCTDRISPQMRGLTWSGRVDLNHRPPGPEPGALTGLRHAPQISRHSCAASRDHGAPGGTRIPNLLIRSQMLYPIELQAPVRICLHHNGGYVSVAETHPPSSPQKLLLLPNIVKRLHPTKRASNRAASTRGSTSMGGTRLELVTSTMSTWRSNQLS
jgi:hypothetical protein